MLSQVKIMWLDYMGYCRLDEGGVCKNKRKDGTPGPYCEMDFADHPTDG